MAEYVCVHLVGFVDGTAESQVIFRGSLADCRLVADHEPPRDDGSPEKPVAREAWFVRRAAEWDSFAASSADGVAPGDHGRGGHA